MSTTAPAPICFVDTETDGVHPGRQAWEIAIIRRDAGKDVEIRFFVEIDLSTADPFGLRVGRFYSRHPLGRYLSDVGCRSVPTDGLHYLAAVDAAHAVARWTHGAHIVGAVPNFDSEVLASLLRAHGLTPAWHYHLIDVENLAVGYLHGRADENPGGGISGAVSLPWDSQQLSRACRVDPPGEDERHTALGDARWAMRLYDAVVNAVPLVQTGEHR